jgi:hypothetical protein
MVRLKPGPFRWKLFSQSVSLGRIAQVVVKGPESLLCQKHRSIHGHQLEASEMRGQPLRPPTALIDFVGINTNDAVAAALACQYQ